MDEKNDECCSTEMMQALSSFGKMLSIASIYGMNHPSIATPLEEARRSLCDALEKDEMVMLGLFNKTLTINDKMLTEYTVHLRALERRFIALDVPHLVFRKGVSTEELGQLLDALCSSGGGAHMPIKERLDAAGLVNIKADKVQYVAQHEGQRLVGDGDGPGDGLEDGANAGAGVFSKKGAEEAEKEAPPEEPEEEIKKNPEPTIKVEQIVAFLKGAPGATDTPGDDLQELVADPEKLGQLIMESADIRQSAQSIDQGESLADIVIGCLRKTYDGLHEQRKYKSPTGKANLHKAMLLLEKTVVDKIRNAVGEEQPEIDAHILEALREAEEQRQVEILAARFVEQQKKITKVEMDILRYVREYGEEKARQMLSSSEIPEEEWNRLMIQNRRSGGSGDGEGGGPGGGGNGGSGEGLDMGALAIVLDKLETIMDLDDIPPEIIKSTVEEVRETVEETAAQATKQVESLEEQVEQHEEDVGKPPEARKSKKSRAELLSELANLALTLSQPLTVITVSIEAALKDSTPPDIRKEVLELACESGQRMKELMKRLTQLVGYPSMKVADAGIEE
ncbi:MAG: hypothetical protein ISR85_02360 [Kiritimatiellales bacterium]|nr:hypothetical protein [Kiritimatiellota bacterium]MBL7011757.1 hypothetical protein [Kiritimatiellales bacterium]